MEEKKKGREYSARHNDLYAEPGEEFRKCAELLPANDKLKAKALCVGGTFTKIRDPQYAYKFYKELIDTCPNTKLGKEALELKWFPEIDF